VDIGIDRGDGIIHHAFNAHSGGKVVESLEALAAAKGGKLFGEICFDEAETGAVFGSCSFEVDAAAGREIVYDGDMVTRGEEGINQMRPNKPGAAGNQDWSRRGLCAGLCFGIIHSLNTTGRISPAGAKVCAMKGSGCVVVFGAGLDVALEVAAGSRLDTIDHDAQEFGTGVGKLVAEAGDEAALLA
jgi:hypothetical protein